MKIIIAGATGTIREHAMKAPETNNGNHSGLLQSVDF
jgi:hypothetical protein